MTPEPPSKVDLLILGAGWTSTFLIPLCASRKISCAATSRPSAPKPDTIPFEFDPNSHDPKGFEVLPDAQTVLITFPIKVKGASRRLVKHYEQTHPNANAAYIQLGSTGIWDVSRSRLLSNYQFSFGGRRMHQDYGGTSTLLSSIRMREQWQRTNCYLSFPDIVGQRS